MVKTTPGSYDNNKPTASGQGFHGDHLYAFYQVPKDPKGYEFDGVSHLGT